MDKNAIWKNITILPSTRVFLQNVQSFSLASSSAIFEDVSSSSVYADILGFLWGLSSVLSDADSSKDRLLDWAPPLEFSDVSLEAAISS